MYALSHWTIKCRIIKDGLRSIIQRTIKRHDDMDLAHASWVSGHDFGHFRRRPCKVNLHIAGFDKVVI